MTSVMSAIALIIPIIIVLFFLCLGIGAFLKDVTGNNITTFPPTFPASGIVMDKEKQLIFRLEDGAVFSYSFDDDGNLKSLDRLHVAQTIKSSHN